MKGENIVGPYLKRFLNLVFCVEGLIYALKHEKNIQLLLIAQTFLFGIAFWRGISIAEFSVLLFSCGTMIALEIFNSSIERLADIVQPQFDPEVKIIKDLLAGGVFVVGTAAFIIWIIVVFF